MSPADLAPRFAVGLTGGIGCGKSTVADLFGARGAAIIDTDVLAHQLTAPGGAAMPALVQAFGAACAGPDGALDRARMRDLVFADPSARTRLEAILHPMIRAATERAAQQARGAYLLFVVPLLVESGAWRARVDRILVIDCQESTQVARVMARSHLPEAQVKAIMAAQASRQARLGAADDVIDNDAGLDALLPQVARLHQFYLACAQGDSERL